MDKEKTINQKYKADKFFQYAATVASNYGEVKFNPEIISNIKPFTNKYSSHKIPIKNRWLEKFEKNKSTSAINVLNTKEMKICPAYISK